MKPVRLNNMQLSYHRKDLTYEAVMIDLVLMGALERATVEKFLGKTIPDYLRAPEVIPEPAPVVEVIPEPEVENV
jgi:hypothetical protein